jgi:transient receptor potential cation channel subfamily V protein 5
MILQNNFKVLNCFAAYYIVFQSYKTGDSGKSNPMETPMEANLAMFLISLANFESYYEAMTRTDHEQLAKVLFVCYIGIAGILLINMLIAMMGNTYTKIAETRNEWQRQVSTDQSANTRTGYL